MYKTCQHHKNRVAKTYVHRNGTWGKVSKFMYHGNERAAESDGICVTYTPYSKHEHDLQKKSNKESVAKPTIHGNRKGAKAVSHGSEKVILVQREILENMEDLGAQSTVNAIGMGSATKKDWCGICDRCREV